MDHLEDWSFASPGYPVWLSDQDEAFVEAVLEKVDGKFVTVRTKAGKQVTVDTTLPRLARGHQRTKSEVVRLLPRGLERLAEGCENMDDLHPLNEASFLSNVEQRFRVDLIYTRTGPILIAMNPFKPLPIYKEEIVNEYHRRQYGELPPHCYQEAEDAFQILRRENIDQSIIICGESGAGKTETTKKMLFYLSAVAKQSAGSGAGKREGGLTLGERMVDSNNFTEAFGNAKTVRNNNSSRFGKFTLFTFSQPRFDIAGGRIRTFLLEKSRVAKQPAGERNYHVFYQLLTGAPEHLKTRLQLKTVADYRYLNQSGCVAVDGLDDADGFDDTADAMEKVGMSEERQEELFRVVAGVLHLGNIDFDASADGEECSVRDAKLAQIAASVLGLDASALQKALVTRVRTVPPQNQVVVSPQTADQARDSRDALAKALYNRLFDLLVEETNTAFDVDKAPDAPFIGVLDIFGFEDLNPNGFEQVFINYTNEKLQALFNEATFKKEVEEYTREQIPFDRREFPDNIPCLHLIDKKPLGLLPFLDSECLRGAVASDKALVAKLHKHNKNHPNYEVCGPATGLRHKDGSLTDDDEFIIRHYAGPIIYKSTGFIDKNRDAVLDHVYDVMTRSSQPVVSRLFPPRTSGGKAVGQTVATRFTTSLNELIEVLGETQSRFVRCIKTNNLLRPQIFDKPSVLRQLITSGVMAALEIRRAGFPTRLTYPDFVKEFRVFAVDKVDPKTLRAAFQHMRSKSQIEAISQQPAGNAGDGALLGDKAVAARIMTHPAVAERVKGGQYRLGLTKIFLQADVLTAMQGIKDAILLPYAVKIQKWWLNKQERILEHKLTRATQLLTSAITKATINGVQSDAAVRDTLEDAITAVRYARSLGLYQADVFKPALDAALLKSQAASAAVADAIRRKQALAQQRAELLARLDSGRARLGRVSEGRRVLSVDTEALLQLCNEANGFIEACRDRIVAVGDRERQTSVLAVDDDDDSSLQDSKQFISRTFTNVAMQLDLQAIAKGAAASSDFSEADLGKWRNDCAAAIQRVDEAEELFARLQQAQEELDKARAASRQLLDRHRAAAAASTAAAGDAGIMEVATVAAAVSATTLAIEKADSALQAHDRLAFEYAVQAAGDAAGILEQVVVRERADKEEEDRRGEGRAVLAQAATEMAAVTDEATTAGVVTRPSMAAAVHEYTEAVNEARMRELSSAAEFIAAARAALAAAGRAAAVGAKEKHRKEANDRLRDAELARLEPAASALENVRERASAGGLSDDTGVADAVGAASAGIDKARRALSMAEDVGTLGGEVQAALALVITAERALVAASQRKDAYDREMGQLEAQLSKLDGDLDALRATVGGSSTALTAAVSDDLSTATASVTDARKAVRKPLRLAAPEADGAAAAIGRTAVAQATSTVRAFESRVQRLQGLLEQAERRRAAASEHLTECRCAMAEATAALAAAATTPGAAQDVAAVRDAASAALATAAALERRPVNAQYAEDGEVAGLEAAAAEARRRVDAFEQAVNAAVRMAQQEARERKANADALAQAEARYEATAARARDLARGGGGAGSSVACAAAATAVEEAEDALAVAQQHVRSTSHRATAARGALEALAARLRLAESAVAAAVRAQEAWRQQHAAAQAQLDTVLQRLEGVVALVNACGPDVAAAAEAALDEAAEAVNVATRVLRRGSSSMAAAAMGGRGGVNGGFDGFEDGGEALVAAVGSASAVVDQAEQHVLRTKHRAAKAEAKRATAVAQLAALAETLSAAQEKAAAVTGGDVSGPEVTAALARAAEAVDVCRARASAGVVAWMTDAAGMATLCAEAADAVMAAEEAVDVEALRRAKARREVAELQAELEHVAELHVAVVLTVEGGPADDDDAEASTRPLIGGAAVRVLMAEVDALIEAARADLSAAVAAAALGSQEPLSGGPLARSVKALRSKVAEEERMAAEERQRQERRLLEARRAEEELPTLQRTLDRLLMSVAAAAPLVSALVEPELSACRQSIEALRRLADANGALAASDGESAVAGASGPISVASTAAQLRAADEAVRYQVGRVERAAAKQAQEVRRLDGCQARYHALCDDIALLTARSDALRMQLEADWKDTVWWGSPSGHTATDGTPNHTRGEVRPASSLAALANAMEAAEAAVAAARRAVEVPLDRWLETGPSFAFEATGAASRAVSSAAALAADETRRLERDEAQRTVAAERLAALAERLAVARALAEGSGAAANATVSEAMGAGEHALDVVGRLLSAGSVAAAPPAMEVASGKVAAAAEAVAREAQRRERERVQRQRASDEVAAAKARAKGALLLAQSIGAAGGADGALGGLFGGLLRAFEANGSGGGRTAAAAAVTAAEESDRAGAAAAPPGEAIRPSAAVVDAAGKADMAVAAAEAALGAECGATAVLRSARLATEAVEELERTVGRERAHRMELRRFKQAQEVATRIRERRAVQEAQHRRDAEERQRRRLAEDLESAAARLASSFPLMDEVRGSMGAAEAAVAAAQKRLLEGGDGAAATSAAVQDALAQVREFEALAFSVEQQYLYPFMATEPPTEQQQQQTQPLPAANTDPRIDHEQHAPAGAYGAMNGFIGGGAATAKRMSSESAAATNGVNVRLSGGKSLASPRNAVRSPRGLAPLAVASPARNGSGSIGAPEAEAS